MWGDISFKIAQELRKKDVEDYFTKLIQRVLLIKIYIFIFYKLKQIFIEFFFFLIKSKGLSKKRTLSKRRSRCNQKIF